VCQLTLLHTLTARSLRTHCALIVHALQGRVLLQLHVPHSGPPGGLPQLLRLTREQERGATPSQAAREEEARGRGRGRGRGGGGEGEGEGGEEGDGEGEGDEEGEGEEVEGGEGGGGGDGGPPSADSLDYQQRCTKQNDILEGLLHGVSETTTYMPGLSPWDAAVL
jgi:hypothetical protein